MINSSIWKHYAAFLYDLFPILGILLLTGFITLLFRNGEEVPPGTLWFNTLIAFEVLFYYIYSWKVGGQTLGMRAWKLKIVSDNSKPGMSWSHAIIRFIIGIVSTSTLGLGVLWKKFSTENKSWMDICSHSKTVSYEKM
jgi:uncharacterized RDD family membrane protein YckC